MKDVLIQAIYEALQDNSGNRDIIDNQDSAIGKLYRERIAPYIDDEAILDELLEILHKATLAAFTKGIEAIGALTSNEIKA